MSAILNICHSILGIVTSGDWIGLAIMAAIALAAGFSIQNLGSLVTATFSALVLLALASYIRAALAGGKSAATLAHDDWHTLLGMTVQAVLAYAILFAIVIAIIHALRALASR